MSASANTTCAADAGVVHGEIVDLVKTEILVVADRPLHIADTNIDVEKPLQHARIPPVYNVQPLVSGAPGHAARAIAIADYFRNRSNQSRASRADSSNHLPA